MRKMKGRSVRNYFVIALSVLLSMLMLGRPADIAHAAGADLTLNADFSNSLGSFTRTEQFENNLTYLPSELRDDLSSFQTKINRVFMGMGGFYVNPGSSRQLIDFTDWTTKTRNGKLFDGFGGSFSQTQLLVITSPARSLGTGSSFDYNGYRDDLETILLNLKQQVPSFEYFECGNEPDLAPMHTYGPVNDVSDYLQHYASCSTAVDWVNAQNPPGNPLKVGGPVLSQWSTGNQTFIADFLDGVQQNAYTLDFVSWHHYNKDARLTKTATDSIQSMLTSRGLTAKTMISEYGWRGGPDPDRAPDEAPEAEDLAHQSGFVTDAAFGFVEGGADYPLNWLSTHQFMPFKSRFYYPGIKSTTNNGWQTYTFSAPVTDRYIHFRDWFQSSSLYDGYHRIKEIRFRDTANNVVAIVASDYSPFAKAWDGNANTILESSLSNVTFDLGSAQPINSVEILWAPVSALSEAESFAASAVGGTVSSGTSSSAHGGAYSIGNLNSTGYVEYTVNISESHAYDVKVGQITGPSRGIWQLQVDGSNVGNPVNAYSPSGGKSYGDVGSISLSAGSHTFRFQITGKDALSSGYTTGIDYITLGADSDTSLNGTYDFSILTSTNNVDWHDPFDKWKLTPNYHSGYMRSQLGTTRVATTGGETGQYGARILATKNSNSKVTLLVWNYQDRGSTNRYHITLNANNLPSDFAGKNIKYTRYLADETHANYIYNGSQSLPALNDEILPEAEDLALDFYLPEHQVTLIVLEAFSSPTTGITKETEVLSVSSSTGDAILIGDVSDGGGGYFAKGDFNASDDEMTFTVAVQSAGAYKVVVNALENTDGGIWQLKVDGTNLGSTFDSYAASFARTAVQSGTVTFASGGNHTFRFQATGKNGASSGYKARIDSINLKRAATIYEAESVPSSVSSGDSQTDYTYAPASGGAYHIATLNGTGDYVNFTLNIPAPGTYSVNVEHAHNNNRAKWYLIAGGSQVGLIIDGYSASSGLTGIYLGTVTFTTAGSHTFHFQVSGKNASSSGYNIAIDDIQLTPN